MTRLIVSLTLLFSALCGYGQEKGFIRGNITDGEFGGPMIGATVSLVSSPTTGSVTDFDGNYSISLAPGTYAINISFISYATITVTDIEVKAGEVTAINAELKSAAEQLDAVVITEKANRSSEAGMLMEMKNASNVVDGMSSSSFKKLGDSDLSGAMNRITGVNVQNGKYVFVRGLGDRYTKTTVNGMPIPGLDPDKNSVQIDIFPTNIVQNVSVYKTFAPDLYGDFAGGLIDITTVSFPEEKTTKISGSLGYTVNQTFNDKYISYDGGNFDWLGIDDGARAQPIPTNEDIPNPALKDPTLTEQTKSFSNQMAALSKTALPAGSFSISHGNQVEGENEKTYGYNAVFNYSTDWRLYEDFRTDDYLKSTSADNYEMDQQISRVGEVGKYTTMWSALTSGSVKTDKSSHTATLLWTQSGESSAAKRVKTDVEQNPSTVYEDVLTFTQRSLGSLILSGQYQPEKFKWEWKNATSYSRVYDPDFRTTGLEETPSGTLLNPTVGGMERFYRDLNEINQSNRLDFHFPLLGSKKAKISTGLAGTYKFRDFTFNNYQFRNFDTENNGGDPNWYLQDENMWTTPDNENGTYVIGDIQPANQYSARQYIGGGYVMAEHPVGGLLKLIYGARIETTGLYFTGQNSDGRTVFDDSLTLQSTDFLPSVNAVYSLNEDMNIRVSANRSIARPSFREKSPSQIVDPISNRTFIGNVDLDQTSINNFDFRYEYFMSPKELIAASVFYKQFDGHIEITPFATGAEQLTPRNSGTSTVAGIEVEFRKALGKVTDDTFLSRFFFAGNVSLIQSAVDMKEVIVDNNGLTEYELRERNLRTGETLEDTRAMAGQSPYMINANFTYQLPDESKTSLTLAYNVQGEQLAIVGSGRVPDVYLQAFHSLNFNAQRFFGDEYRQKISFRINNILNDDMEQLYKSYEAQNQVFSAFSPGIQLTIGYQYTF